MTPEFRGRVLLSGGALLGIALAAAGALTPLSDGELPDEAIARVNDHVIRREAFESMLELLARDRRGGLVDGDRAHVLNRMIDEELLVQRGEAVGLVDSESNVRKSIVSAMIDSVVAESLSREPEESELRAFYTDNPGYFAPPRALRVRRLLFQAGEDREDPELRARAVGRALMDGADFDRTLELGDPALHPLPDVLLPPSALREYIGPSALEVVVSLEPGEVSEPLRSPYGWQILELVEREERAVPRFEEIREQVEAAYVRRAGDRALRETLDWLREDAEIVLSPEAPR